MAEQLEHAEVEALVNELQKKLDRLRVLYEQFFIGISKREPSVPLKDVVRLVHRLDQQQIRNTGLRFRLRSLIQKFQVYRTQWARTMRAIEAGTYKRDVARVRRKYKRQGVEMPELNKLKTQGDIERAMKEAGEEAARRKKRGTSGKIKKRLVADDIRGVPAEALRKQTEAKEPALGQLISEDDADDALDALFGGDSPPPAPSPPPPTSKEPARRPPPTPAERQAEPHKPTAAPAGPPPSRRPPRPAPARRADGEGHGEAQVDSIYRRMVKAKRMVGENADSISRQGLAKTIEKQLPKLRQMHPGKEIDFQVVIRKGKVVLKARPK